MCLSGLAHFVILGARHIIQRALNPRLLTLTASYDVAWIKSACTYLVERAERLLTVPLVTGEQAPAHTLI